MLGHTNISTTQIYARVTNDKIGKDMEGISNIYGDIENLIDHRKSATSRNNI